MATIHPGKILINQYLTPKSISQNALAKAISVPPRRINEIILGKRGISADTAARLAEYFGNSASYWMHLQAEYDIRLTKDKIRHELNLIQPLNSKPADSPRKPDTPKSKIRRRIMR